MTRYKIGPFAVDEDALVLKRALTEAKAERDGWDRLVKQIEGDLRCVMTSEPTRDALAQDVCFYADQLEARGRLTPWERGLLALLRQAANVLRAADPGVGGGSSSPWQPIETLKPDPNIVVLRPHRIWGAMDVRYLTDEQRSTVHGTLQAGIPWRWMNGDYTTAWTEEAFLPFWMPLPAPPSSPSPEKTEKEKT